MSVCLSVCAVLLINPVVGQCDVGELDYCHVSERYYFSYLCHGHPGSLPADVYAHTLSAFAVGLGVCALVNVTKRILAIKCTL